MTEILLHIPHSSTRIPAYSLQRFVRPEPEIRRLAEEIADLYTEQLFDLPFDQLVAPCSRLVVDVERFADNQKEVMAGKGLGVIYERYYDGGLLRTPLNPLVRSLEMVLLYRRHHRALLRMVERRLAAFGKCLIIDAHSFSQLPNPMDLDQGPDRPDLCIGTDPVHTPPCLTEALIRESERLGWSAAVNRPFSGTMVPMPLYGDRRVSSVMIEINKKLYLDGTDLNTSRFFQVKDGLSRLVLAAAEMQ